jgi:hypothetical protein
MNLYDLFLVTHSYIPYISGAHQDPDIQHCVAELVHPYPEFESEYRFVRAKTTNSNLRAAVRRPRVRISARHPSGDPLPELAAMKKLERNSANVTNECV